MAMLLVSEEPNHDSCLYGVQIGYTTVFFWEYFGPLAVYALIYFFPQFVYFSQ
jgi:hypothetical protein